MTQNKNTNMTTSTNLDTELLDHLKAKIQLNNALELLHSEMAPQAIPQRFLTENYSQLAMAYFVAFTILKCFDVPKYVEDVLKKPLEVSEEELLQLLPFNSIEHEVMKYKADKYDSIVKEIV